MMAAAAPLSPDTQATLLLCGRFGPAHDRIKLLSPSEYHDLAQSLEGHKINFGDLLKPDAKPILRAYTSHVSLIERLLVLLRRNDELAAALDRWSRMGIWVVGHSDPNYPARLRRRLKHGVLPLLFGVGPRSLLDGGGVCIVGSRDSSAQGLEFARILGARCGREGLTVISSDMRGVDREAVIAALDAGGRVICVLSDSLEKALSAKRYRPALAAGTLAMVTPFSPDTRFKIANAIRANKYQYALSDAAVIVETRQTGGVWLGADENRQEGWVPAFVRAGENMAPGNLALLHLGLRPITRQDVAACESLYKFFLTHGLSGHGSEVAAKVSMPPGRSVKAIAPVDLYSIFVAELRSIVSAAPRSASEIADHFGIEPGQARAWLARALDDGIVKKIGQDEYYTAR